MSVYYMFNKPMGYITARTDARHMTVMDLFPEELRNTVFPVGRLDKDTEGLLLVTDDGELTYKLLTPESHVEKTYLFYSIGTFDKEKLSHLTDGAEVFPTKDYISAPATVKILDTTTLAFVKDVLPARYKQMAQKKPHREVTIGEITITEGKKHQVKHMVAYAGGEVVYLKRVAIGCLKLDESLEKGSYRPLTEAELSILKNITEDV